MNQPNSGHLEDPSSRNHVDAGLRGSPNLCFGNLQVLTKENPNSWIQPLGLLMFLLPIQLIYWTKQNNPKQSIYIILYNNVCPVYGLLVPAPFHGRNIPFVSRPEPNVDSRWTKESSSQKMQGSAMPVPCQCQCHAIFCLKSEVKK